MTNLPNINPATREHFTGDAGSTFNYDVWTPNTKVRLVNVPWNSDYRDIVRFKDDNDLRAYLDKLPGVTIDHMTTAKVNQPVRLDLSFNAASFYNYLYVTNGDTAGWSDKRFYYYFITDVQYLAPHTTQLALQLDVYQTFGYGVTFGRSYLERGHAGVAHTAQFKGVQALDEMQLFLTTPEGLDLGADMMVKETAVEVMMSTNDTATSQQKPSIVVMSTVSLSGSWGTTENPIMESANGSMMENLPHGCELYWFDTVNDFKSFMTKVSKFPWIAQGIISIQAVPSFLKPPVSTTYNAENDVRLYPIEAGSINETMYFFKERLGALNSNIDTRMDTLYPRRYRHLRKFLMSPYTMFELTTAVGQPLVLKPELWRTGQIRAVYHLSPPGARLSYYPFKYNAANDSLGDQKTAGGLPYYKADGGEHWDIVTSVSNLPSFSLVNNSYISFLASNANSIAYQYSSADWSQQRALAGNELGFNQSTNSMDTTQQLSNIGINATQLQTNLANQSAGAKVITGAVGGVLGGALSGGLAGAGAGVGSAAMSGINYAIDANQRNQSTAIANSATSSSTGAIVSNMGYARDTNKAYADMATKGDYSNAIAGINAKVQDAKLIQPTTSGQLGGDAFMLTTATGIALTVKVKTPTPGAIRAIGEYWLRFGYAHNGYVIPPRDLKMMSHFTYWKFKETYIVRGDCPETFKQSIRGIFESGVTVWSKPEYIGVVDTAQNFPLTVDGVVM